MTSGTRPIEIRFIRGKQVVITPPDRAEPKGKLTLFRSLAEARPYARDRARWLRLPIIETVPEHYQV